MLVINNIKIILFGEKLYVVHQDTINLYKHLSKEEEPEYRRYSREHPELNIWDGEDCQMSIYHPVCQDEYFKMKQEELNEK